MFGIEWDVQLFTREILPVSQFHPWEGNIVPVQRGSSRQGGRFAPSYRPRHSFLRPRWLPRVSREPFNSTNKHETTMHSCKPRKVRSRLCCLQWHRVRFRVEHINYRHPPSSLASFCVRCRFASVLSVIRLHESAPARTPRDARNTRVSAEPETSF